MKDQNASQDVLQSFLVTYLSGVCVQLTMDFVRNIQSNLIPYKAKTSTILQSFSEYIDRDDFQDCIEGIVDVIP